MRLQKIQIFPSGGPFRQMGMPQTTSATAEESAAASEELSAEAASLKQLVDEFTLATD